MWSLLKYATTLAGGFFGGTFYVYSKNERRLEDIRKINTGDKEKSVDVRTLVGFPPVWYYQFSSLLGIWTRQSSSVLMDGNTTKVTEWSLRLSQQDWMSRMEFYQVCDLIWVTSGQTLLDLLSEEKRELILEGSDWEIVKDYLLGPSERKP